MKTVTLLRIFAVTILALIICNTASGYHYLGEGALEFCHLAEPGGSKNGPARYIWPGRMFLYKINNDNLSCGLDSQDIIIPYEDIYVPSSYLCSEINGTDEQNWELVYDFRPLTDSNEIIYKLILKYNGTSNGSLEDYLLFYFHVTNPPSPYPPFGYTSMILYSPDGDFMSGAYKVDLRRILNLDCHFIQLKNIPEGTYRIKQHERIFYLNIHKDISIADIDNNDSVDLSDFVILTDNYGQISPNPLADISGPNYIPDGLVDFWDLKVFFEEWLSIIKP